MSEALKGIWAWWDDDYDVCVVSKRGDKNYIPHEAREYIRADLVEAAIKRALEAAAAEISPHPDHDKADWTEYAHHAHRLAQLIRALDPAQFIEEPKP